MSFSHAKHVPRQRRRSSVPGARGEGGGAPAARRTVPAERQQIVLGKLTFDSTFEGGNGFFEADGGTYCVWTQCDMCGTEYENGNRSWFHFSVSGGTPDQTITLRVCGMNKLKYLYDRGMRPVYKRDPTMQKYERWVPLSVHKDRASARCCMTCVASRLPPLHHGTASGALTRMRDHPAAESDWCSQGARPVPNLHGRSGWRFSPMEAQVY